MQYWTCFDKLRSIPVIDDEVTTLRDSLFGPGIHKKLIEREQRMEQEREKQARVAQKLELFGPGVDEKLLERERRMKSEYKIVIDISAEFARKFGAGA